MNRDELEELLSFDMASMIFFNLGQFCLAGGLWLGIEKYLDSSGNPLPPLFWFCVAATILGLGLLAVGLFLFVMRRQKIKRIFAQTTVVGTSRSASPYVSAV